MEIQNKLEEDPVFKSAWESLTPGRQRSYIIHISQAKQATTRISRLEKCLPKIFLGQGLHDKYQSKKKNEIVIFSLYLNAYISNFLINRSLA